ncbi:hypothetical protein SAMN04489727_3626 [Amycolatopsis tolypomycina]|uniref:Uncharacterized protein n=1 Tax=Amycolatopsis tolypomycina TaxID=208445 RepID=A0A1H4S8C9_9PSEU|nr:hypothetical protein [Amycolatopsis tolypomycina]SEC40244.1 hypothetical protein SAMN04489727_3626 [Amycolatopsis tolypomycina]
MAELPLRDRAGNMLLAVRQVAESELPPVSASLVVALAFAAVAEFDLAEPRRREFLAVYRVELAAARLVLSVEGLGFRWWPPREPVAELAARATT